MEYTHTLVKQVFFTITVVSNRRTGVRKYLWDRDRLRDVKFALHYTLLLLLYNARVELFFMHNSNEVEYKYRDRHGFVQLNAVVDMVQLVASGQRVLYVKLSIFKGNLFYLKMDGTHRLLDYQKIFKH